MIFTAFTGLSLKQWFQIGAIIAVVIALVWAWASFQSLRNEAAKVPGLQQELSVKAAELQQLRDDIIDTQTASKGYQDELKRLKDAATVAGPIPVVRVCKSAKSVPAATPAQPRPDEGTPAGGVLPQEPGPDIGPALYGDADLADELSAQIRGLEYYIQNVCLKGG